MHRTQSPNIVITTADIRVPDVVDALQALKVIVHSRFVVFVAGRFLLLWVETTTEWLILPGDVKHRSVWDSISVVTWSRSKCNDEPFLLCALFTTYVPLLLRSVQ